MLFFVVILFTSLVSLFAVPSGELKGYLLKLERDAKNQDSNFKGFSKSNGKRIFTTTRIGKRGKPISCNTCHGKDLTKRGENKRTGKVIEPLAPSANPKSLAKVKKIKKWLRRNFRDVYKRVGTPQEKGDVLYYLMEQ
jgi:hypothetical protein